VLSADTGKRIWFHCASLGEFEQARPVIEALKKQNNQTRIILTFFSPSGYEIRKNYEFADAVLYLPLDTRANANHFLELMKPDLAVFVKYEFWYHYLAELKERKTPTLLFSAIFRKEQVFFKWYGGLFRKMLGMFNTILVQNEMSASLLKEISIQSQVVSDTRFDRVYQISQRRKSFPAVDAFKGTGKVFIAGSTWPKDDKLIIKMAHDQILKKHKYIIAPHDIDEQKLLSLENSFPGMVVTRLSALNESNAISTMVLLVDSVGDLASLYAYSHMAYVGGGFNVSVHNVLEPAVYGIPLIFGPNHLKSAEAIDLISNKAAIPISSYLELILNIRRLDHYAKVYESTGKAAKDYVLQRLGGTEKVLDQIHKLLSL